MFYHSKIGQPEKKQVFPWRNLFLHFNISLDIPSYEYSHLDDLEPIQSIFSYILSDIVPFGLVCLKVLRFLTDGFPYDVRSNSFSVEMVTKSIAQHVAYKPALHHT